MSASLVSIIYIAAMAFRENRASGSKAGEFQTTRITQWNSADAKFIFPPFQLANRIFPRHSCRRSRLWIVKKRAADRLDPYLIQRPEFSGPARL